MAKFKYGQKASGAIAVCGVAALMLSVAPVQFDELLVSSAQAAGQGSGGNSDAGSGGGGGNSGGSGGSDSGNRAGQSDDKASATGAKSDDGDDGSNAKAGSGQQGGAAQGGSGSASSGQQGAGSGGQMGDGSEKDMADIMKDVTGEDSDRPDWAGSPGGKDGAGGGQPDNAGSTKGDLFGDLFIIARDDNGIPILTPEGWVQPLDVDGNLIASDDEGHPVDESLTVEVELGRLNVGRAPAQVLDRRADEVIDLMMTATDLTTDAAGRLVFTIDGETKTIDSPLENLSIYVALMTTGTIPGVDDLPGSEFDFLVDGALTAEDLEASPIFLAATTDKTGVMTPDEIAYIDAFLGINTETVGKVTYSDIDYSGFTYDREATYGDASVEVLVLQDDGSWVPEVINVYDVVFEGASASGAGTLTAYTQAADDARAIVNFIHEYEVPAADIGDVTH